MDISGTTTTYTGETNNSVTLAKENTWNEMINNSQVHTTLNGQWVELVFNESFLLLEREGNVNIRLPAMLNRWELRLRFQNSLDRAAMTAEREISGSLITMTYFNWYADTWMENTEPHNFATDNHDLNLFMKMRTTANRTQNFRQVHVTIWRLR